MIVVLFIDKGGRVDIWPCSCEQRLQIGHMHTTSQSRSVLNTMGLLLVDSNTHNLVERRGVFDVYWPVRRRSDRFLSSPSS